MRVCNPTLGMEPNSGSGGEVYEREFCRALDTLEPVHYHRPGRFRGRPPLVWADMTRTLRRCDGVLRIHSLRYLGLPAVLSHRPFIAHCHHLERGPWLPLEKWVLRRAAHVTVDSIFGMTQIVGMAGVWNTTRIHAVPGGVGPEFSPPDLPIPGRTVLHLGQKKWRKNPEFLHRLRLRLEGHGVRLRIIGPGWEGPPLADRDKPALYRSADVFVFPSTLEGFGLPVLEAMASGLPVFVSTQPALMELVTDGVEGRVLPLDLDLWVDAVLTIFRVQGQWAAMRGAALATAKQYSWGRSARAWLKAASQL